MASFVPQSYLYQLANLKSQILSDSIATIYVLTGNQNAGKKTLIHYMIDSNMQHGIDEEGQDILTIHQQQQKQLVIENVLEIFKCEDRQILFIKLIGFLSSNRDQQQKKKWALCVDYLIRLLSFKKQANIKFILIFSLQQLQEDDQILTKYYNAFKQISDLVNRTHIVLSKLVDEDQFNQFVQITSEQILLPEDNNQFLKQIINNEHIFGFYSREIEQTERYQFNQKLESTFVEEKLHINNEGSSILQLFHEYQLDLHQIFQQYYQFLKIGIKLINCFYIDILNKACKLEDKSNSEEIEKLITKLYGQPIQYSIKSEIQQKTLIEKYEKDIKRSRQSGQQFLQYLFTEDQFLNNFLNSQSCNFIASTEILLLVCMVSAEKKLSQLFQNQQLLNIFAHDNGVFEDHNLIKAFNCHKKYFSSQFVEQNEKLLSKGVTKKKKKKIVQKNMIPNYQEQKKGFGERSIAEIQELVYSPLKLDLLIEYVDKIRKNNQRNIKQQKRIINLIIKVLEVYRCYLEAAKFAFICPLNYLIQTEIVFFLVNSMQLKRGEDLSVKDKQFIEKVFTYFSKINRPELVQMIQKTLENITQGDRKDRANIVSLKSKIQTLTYSCEGEQIAKEAKNSFMNYEQVSDILKNKQSLIEKCINFEASEPQLIQREIVIKWILKADQIKLV